MRAVQIIKILLILLEIFVFKRKVYKTCKVFQKKHLFVLLIAVMSIGMIVFILYQTYIAFCHAKRHNKSANNFDDPLYLAVRKLILNNTFEKRYSMKYKTDDLVNIYLETKDGQKIGGALLIEPPEINESTLFFVFCHGNNGNRFKYAAKTGLQQLSKLNVCFLILDYREYGDSTGIFTDTAVNLDLDAAFDFMRSKYGIPDIYIAGHSLGSAIALRYCAYLSEKNPELLPIKIFCLAPFSSMMDICDDFFAFRMVSMIFPHIKERLSVELNFDNISNAKKFSSKLIIFHGKNDEIINFTHSLRIEMESKCKIYVTNHRHLEIVEDRNIWQTIFNICRNEKLNS